MSSTPPSPIPNKARTSSGLPSPDPPAPSGETSPPPNGGTDPGSPIAAPPDADDSGELEVDAEKAGDRAAKGDGTSAGEDAGCGTGAGRGV